MDLGGKGRQPSRCAPLGLCLWPRTFPCFRMAQYWDPLLLQGPWERNTGRSKGTFSPGCPREREEGEAVTQTLPLHSKNPPSTSLSPPPLKIYIFWWPVLRLWASSAVSPPPSLLFGSYLSHTPERDLRYPNNGNGQVIFLACSEHSQSRGRTTLSRQVASLSLEMPPPLWKHVLFGGFFPPIPQKSYTFPPPQRLGCRTNRSKTQPESLQGALLSGLPASVKTRLVEQAVLLPPPNSPLSLAVTVHRGGAARSKTPCIGFLVLCTTNLLSDAQVFMYLNHI